MKNKIILPPHLQELVKKANEKEITFGYKIEEIDCDEIFKIDEENKNGLYR
jgi:hypothetical protein